MAPNYFSIDMKSKPGSSSALLDNGGKHGARLVDAPPAAHPAAHRYGLKAFIEDTQDISGGTLPVSVVIATVIGIVCGVVAWVYYTGLEYLLEVIWKSAPERFFVGDSSFPESLYWTWIPIVGITCAAGVGLSVQILGEPGDLAYTVGCVHKKGYIAMSHVLPMVFASQFSILAGGSLGPEAPLVAICAAVAGWVSRSVFGQKYKNVVRKHTLMGMACALAAFFGVPLGGSLFAVSPNEAPCLAIHHCRTFSDILCGGVLLSTLCNVDAFSLRSTRALDTSTLSTLWRLSSLALFAWLCSAALPVSPLDLSTGSGKTTLDRLRRLLFRLVLSLAFSGPS